MSELRKKAVQMNNSFKTIKIKEASHDKLRFISQLLNEPQCDVISSIADQIFELFIGFKTIESIEWDKRVLANNLTLTIYGDRRIISNMLTIPKNTPNRKIDKMIKKDILNQKLEGL